MSEKAEAVDDEISSSAPALEEGQARTHRYAEEAIPLRSAREREVASESSGVAEPIGGASWRRASLPSFRVPHLAMRARSAIALAGLAAVTLILMAIALRGESPPTQSPAKVPRRAPQRAPLARIVAPRRAQPRRAAVEPQRRRADHRHLAGDRPHRASHDSTPASTATATSVPPPSPVAESPAPEPPPPPVSSSPPMPPPQGQPSQLERQFGFER